MRKGLRATHNNGMNRSEQENMTRSNEGVQHNLHIRRVWGSLFRERGGKGDDMYRGRSKGRIHILAKVHALAINLAHQG